jgi:hypothetical protein
MENRRLDYRHDFPPTRPVLVTLKTVMEGRAIEGDLIDLSISGMCVYASALRNEDAEKWTISLALEPDAPPLDVIAERIHRRDSDPARVGFRFLASDDQEKADEQERRIWKFLLDQQRRRRSAT